MSTQPSATPRTDAVCIPITEPVTLDYCQLEMLARTLETELARLRAENERLKASANHYRDLGITLLDAKWLDPECHTGCQSLAWKARAERAEAALAEWSVLNLWGGTPEIIHEFIKGQQNRIHYCQNIEDELAAARKDSERLDWLNGQGLGFNPRAWSVWDFHTNVRDAIDAAMNNSQNT